MKVLIANMDQECGQVKREDSWDRINHLNDKFGPSWHIDESDFIYVPDEIDPDIPKIVRRDVDNDCVWITNSFIVVGLNKLPKKILDEYFENNIN